jgi:hypothetical protein
VATNDGGLIDARQDAWSPSSSLVAITLFWQQQRTNRGRTAAQNDRTLSEGARTCGHIAGRLADAGTPTVSVSAAANSKKLTGASSVLALMQRESDRTVSTRHSSLHGSGNMMRSRFESRGGLTGFTGNHVRPVKSMAVERDVGSRLSFHGLRVTDLERHLAVLVT